MSFILIVDDSAIFRDPMAELLRRGGHEVACASNGEEALSLMREVNPDLVLLDVRMPVMDGLTCLRQIRGQERWKQLPVLLIAAVSDPSYVDEANKLGVVGCLEKTRFTLQQMIDTVVSHLPPRRA